MTGHVRSRTGLTLIELVVMIAVMGLLAAILLPVLTPPRGCREGEGRACLSNLKQLGLGMLMYAQDYDDHYPSYHPDSNIDWGAGPWGPDGQAGAHFHSSSYWIAQLLPYVKNQAIFRCPKDANPERNHASVTVPDSTTPFPVSYGPNLMFIDPVAYGRPDRPIASASVDEPAQKYLLGDCVTAYGFDLDTIAYLRYPNYDPSLRQNGWSVDQLTGLGRVAWPDKDEASLTRHWLRSSMVLFADGHAKRLRYSRIPNNDRPYGQQHRELEGRMVPWKPFVPNE